MEDGEGYGASLGTSPRGYLILIQPDVTPAQERGLWETDYLTSLETTPSFVACIALLRQRSSLTRLFGCSCRYRVGFEIEHRTQDTISQQPKT